MAGIIALANLKGGVGKSTLATNIAGALAPKSVLVDADPQSTATAWGDATAAALAICDLAVVPVSPSGADLRATNKAIELINQARTAAGAEIEAVLHDYGEPVAPVISQRIAHADAFTAGQWIGDYAKGSAAHNEIKALASVIKRIIDKREKK